MQILTFFVGKVIGIKLFYRLIELDLRRVFYID